MFDEQPETPPAGLVPRPRGRFRTIAVEIVAVVVIVAAVLGVLIGHALWSGQISTTPPTSPPFVPTSSQPHSGQGTSAAGEPADTASLARQTDPSLVDIDITDTYQAVEGAGTGIVLTSTGEVLTNNHVIEGATTINVTDVGNGTTYGATVVGYDRSHDVAILQLTGASHLRTARMGDSSTVAPGQGVVAVGNAGGAGGTPSYAGGSVTAIDQTITAQDELGGNTEQLGGLIETNTDIIPGDSGGALVNASGQVVGMTTAASEGFQFGTSSTAGYAIPIDQALTIAQSIEARRSSSTIHIGPTAFLGVQVVAVGGGESGAGVVEVEPGTPAAAAGLSRGDVIRAVGGHPVASPESLTELLLAQEPGTSESLAYLDPSGELHTVTIRLASGPPQ